MRAPVVLCLLAWLVLSGCNEPSAPGRGVPAAAAHGVEIIVANGLGETLSMVSFDGRVVAVARDMLPAGLAPCHIVARGGRAFLVNALSHTVQVIDLPSRAVVRTVSVGLGTNPMELVLCEDAPGACGYVSLFAAGAVAYVDLGPDGGVIETVALPLDLPRDAGVARTLPFPGGLAIAGRRLFVALANLQGEGGVLRAGGPGAVAVIDIDPASAAYHTVTEVIVLEGRNTTGLCVSETLPGIVMAVSAGDYGSARGFAGNGVVEFIDAASLRIAARMPLDGFHGGAAPFEALIAGARGYLADGARGRLVTFDVALVEAVLDAAGGGVADASGALAGVIDLPGSSAVLSYASGLAAWGPYLFALEFNHDLLVVIDTRDGRIVETVFVGDGPDALCVWSPSTAGQATVQGMVWFGRASGGGAAVLDHQGRTVAQAEVDGGGRFVLDVPASAARIEVRGVRFDALADGRERIWPEGFVLRAPAERIAVAATPLSDLVVRVAAALGDETPEGVARAGRRLSRHFAGVDVMAYPDDPLTEAVEGDRAAGLLMAALALEAQARAPANPGEYLAALARDAADGRFDGTERGVEITVGGEPLGADAAGAALAAALARFAAGSLNAGGGQPAAALLQYLESTSGILPPEEGDYDYTAPVAVARIDGEPFAGVPVLMCAAQSSDDRGIVSYEWDFNAADGIGVDASGVSVWHVFPVEGRYAVTLTVRDAWGNAGRDVLDVIVMPAGGAVVAVMPQVSFLSVGEALRPRVTVGGIEVSAPLVSSSPGVVRVDRDGSLYAEAAGEAIIEAAYGPLVGRALVRVGSGARHAVSGDTVYRVPAGGGMLEAAGPGGAEVFALDAERPVRALAVWAARSAFAVLDDTVLAVDLRGGGVIDSVPLGGVERMGTLADHVVVSSGGVLAAFSPEDLRVVEVDGAVGGDAVTALGSDRWGRLWVARASEVTVWGPRFSTAGGVLSSPDPPQTFDVPGALIAGVAYLPWQDGCVLWDGHDDRIYTVAVPAPWFQPAGAAVVTAHVLDGAGFGIESVYALSDGRLAAESRRGGVTYLFTLGVDGPRHLTIEPFAWERMFARMRWERRLPAAERYAAEVLEYDVKGRPGVYMNPFLALGGPRGGGGNTGGTHVVSLGDREAPGHAAEAGRGGALTLGFGGRLVLDGPGPDLVVFENPFFIVGGGGLFCEALIVQVSQDGEVWHEFPWSVNEARAVTDPLRYAGLAGVTPVRANHGDGGERYLPIPAADPAAGGDRFDLALLGLKWIRYVRLVDGGGEIDDAGNAPFWGERGADVDAVAVLHPVRDPLWPGPDTTAPAARIDGPAGPVPAGGPVYLSAAGSTDDRGVVCIFWDLDHGDGDFTLDPDRAFSADATGPEAWFTPQGPGECRVSVVVFDAAGNWARAERVIHVEGE